MAEKTALIAHGGALKTAYAGGFLYQLGKSGLTSFDFVAGTSASAGIAAYFVAGQYNDIRSIWLDYVAKNRDFVSWWRFIHGQPIIDVPYLMEVMRHQRPLDREALVRSPSLLVLPRYNYTRRKREYHTNKDSDAHEEIFDAIQIGMAIHKDHTICNGGECYADSEIEPYALYCDSVLDGATHTLIIRNDSDETFDLAKRVGTWLYRRASGEGIPPIGHELLKRREQMFSENKKCFEKYRGSRQAQVHVPPKEARIGWWSLVDGRESNIRRMFDSGARSAITFLNDPAQSHFVATLRKRSQELGTR